ncbi:MAG: phosphatase PAP2 family protein [Tannerellaceae bacterium]|jgi:membrane-associated phospholipid phosphatase|nr:phosphatase PAP2 family protein [Tannerellaceae bacterium]
MNILSLRYLFLLAIPFVTSAQGDSLSLTATLRPEISDFRYTRLILPTALIAYGVASQVSPALDRLDKKINEALSNPGARIDDFIQYAPAAAVYGLDWAGVKAKHNFRDRTFVALSSHLIMGASVYVIKHTSGVMRPDNSARNSFPSGHTAVAFTGAHLLFKEYNDVSPWISVAGYGVATATAVMRMVNRRHWLSDVVAGAGIGILSVEAGYLLLPVFRRMMGPGAPDMVIVPMGGGGMYGAGLALRF